MTMFFFGDPPWLYADIENALKRPIPAGASCLFCPEPIGEGDHGGWVPYIDSVGFASSSPYHYECQLVSTFSAPHHVVPLLTGCNVDCDPPGKCQEGFTRRELGRGIIDELKKYNAPQ